MGAGLGRHASEEGEAGDSGREFLQPIDAHQVDVIGHAVDQVNWLSRRPRLGDFPSMDRNGARPVPPARNTSGRLMLAQIEAARRADERDRCAGTALSRRKLLITPAGCRGPGSTGHPHLAAS